jgi:hypothetical protein
MLAAPDSNTQRTQMLSALECHLCNYSDIAFREMIEEQNLNSCTAGSFILKNYKTAYKYQWKPVMVCIFE